MVLDGLEASLGASYWALEDTDLYRVTLGFVTYSFNSMRCTHTLAEFARRWFFTEDSYEDLTSLGARAGFHLRARNAMLALGMVYEKLLDCPDQLDDECISVYPEFGLSILF